MRIPFEITDIEVLDLSHIVEDAKLNIETDPEQGPDIEQEFETLYIELLGYEIGLIRVGDKIFVIDRHGFGEEVVDDKRLNLAFHVCVRVIHDKPIDKGMEICTTTYPVQIPKSILLDMPVKGREHLEDFIVSFSEGLDTVYEEWIQLLMAAYCTT